MLRSNPFEPDERVYKEAKSLLKNGYEVTLLCWDRELKYPQEDEFEKIKIVRIPLKAGYGTLKELIYKMPLFWIKLFTRGLKTDFDVVHSYDYDTLPAGVWLKWFRGKKLVYDALELFYSYTSNRTVNKGMFFIEKLNLPFIDGLIYTNQERLKIFTKKTGIENRLVGNIIILHNYPELGLEPGNKKKEEKSLYEDKIVLQYNGGVKEDRNLLNILKALKEIENDKIIFLIIGNHHTSYGDVLKEHVNEHGLENMVEFHDFVPLSELLKILQKTQVGFVPLLKDSLNNLIPEPNKLYNYFATGNLAVVEDTPYLKKIVSDENLGLTCDFSSVSDIKKNLQWILENPGEVEIIINRAYQKYLDEYNWNKQEKNLINLYENIIN